MRSTTLPPLFLALAGVAAVAAPAPSAPAAPKPAMAVPFIEDDYAKALAEARGKKLPIFVEAWAPW